MLRKCFGMLLLLLLATPMLTWAQNTGKISGVITDVATGDPLPGASIAVVGTTRGAISDADGNYFIIGVPVGNYDVQASFVGFVTETRSGVEVTANYTREINFALRENIGELDEVVVEYERPIIQKDAIGVPRVVSSEDIENLPVRGVAAVAAIQSGVVSSETSSALYIRGGREQEVTYYVDGVKVIGSTAVPTQAIQEQEMLIGSIPARYGDAMSGVISVTTKSGNTNFFGSVEAITSEVLDDYGYNNLAATVGGPLLGQRLGFFLSGEFQDRGDVGPRAIGFGRLSDSELDLLYNNPQAVLVHDDDDNEFFVNMPGGVFDFFADSLEAWGGVINEDSVANYIQRNLADGLTLVDAHPEPIAAPLTYNSSDFSRENARINNGQTNYIVNGNMTFSPIDAIRIRLGGGYQFNNGTLWSRAQSLYSPRDFAEFDRFTTRFSAAWTHYLSNSTFYQVQADYTDFRGYNYDADFGRDIEDALFYEDIDHPSNAIAARYIEYDADNHIYERRYSDGILPNFSDIHSNWAAPGTGSTGYFKFHNERLGFRASATTQLGLHQIEFGGEYEQQTNRQFNLFGTASLARYYVEVSRDASGNLLDANGNVIGTGFQNFEDVPDNLVGDIVFQEESEISSRELWAEQYSDLTFQTLDDNAVWYGYDFLGLNEVDDQDVEAFAARQSADGRSFGNIAPWKPIYYAGYISDKLEYRDIVLQLGVRVDVFDNNTLVLRDPYSFFEIERANAIGARPSNIGADFAVYRDGQDNVVGYRDLNGRFYDTNGQETLASAIRQDLEGTPTVTSTDPTTGDVLLKITDNVFTDYEPQVTFQPRIGVSFPVTDQALFYASYDVVAQRPTENNFDTIQEFQQATEGSERNGNPALEPEKTTQYELGFRQRLGEKAAIQLSGFYRTIENKISRRIVQNAFPNNYQHYENVDFGTVKGVELEFDLRRTSGVSFNANYTLSFAQGTGGDADATSQITWRQETDPFYPRFITPLGFDQRHRFNATLDYRLGQDEGPKLGNFYPLSNFGFNMVATVASGFPYTPRTDDSPIYTGFNGFLEGEINGETMPSSAMFNLRVDRRFNLGDKSSLTLYLWVQNLFDADNVQAVYAATGLPDDDGFLSQGTGQDLVNSIRTSQGNARADSFVDHYNLRARSPFNYGIPRQTRLGVRLNF